jgi:rhodanese-related sulfurtransferase
MCTAPSGAASLGRVSAPASEQIGIAPERLAEWLTEDPALQVIDVREPYEREAGHIADTQHIELTKLSERAADLDSSRPVVFYCRVGSRSTMAAQAFRASGFRAYSMDGGLVRWAAEQRPLEPADGHVAQH